MMTEKGRGRDLQLRAVPQYRCLDLPGETRNSSGPNYFPTDLYNLIVGQRRSSVVFRLSEGAERSLPACRKRPAALRP